MNTHERISLIMSMLVAEDTPTDDDKCLACEKLSDCDELGKMIEQDLLLDLLAKRMGIEFGDNEDINPIFGLPEADLIPKAEAVLYQRERTSEPETVEEWQDKRWLN